MLGISTEFRHARAVVPHATNPIKLDGLPVSRLFVGTGGTVVCRCIGDTADATFTVPTGGSIDGQFTHVRATSGAALMLAQW